MSSSDIYAKPDFSKKVRCNRKQQEGSSDWDECEVKIYNHAYESVEYATGVQSPEQASQTNTSPEVQKRCCRCDKWCLLVLCTLLLAVLIILSSSYMVVNINNLQKEVREQKLKYDGINKTLSDERKQLKYKIERKMCPELWMRFGSSCYYKSIQKKSWTDSRSFCQEKGADLVVINSKEEQEFVSKLSPNKDSWIGLSAEGSSQDSKWKWVDGSSRTERFWENDFSRKAYYNTAVVLNDDGKWKDLYKTDDKNWICEN